MSVKACFGCKRISYIHKRFYGGGVSIAEEKRMYGYARVSSKEQNLDRQLVKLTEYGVNPRDIICDKQSGKDFNRQGYKQLKEQLLRSGDTLVVSEIDRLGRNLNDIRKEYSDLCEMGVNIQFLDNPMISTCEKSDIEKQVISSVLFELMGYFAEKERLKIHQRCAEGIANAKRNGVKFGRPQVPKPPEWDTVYKRWRSGEITAVKAMQILGLKRSTFYRFAKEEQ